MANNPTDLSWLAGITEKNAALTTQTVNNRTQTRIIYNMKNNPQLIQEIHTLLTELEINHKTYKTKISVHRKEAIKKLSSLLTPYLRGERRYNIQSLGY